MGMDKMHKDAMETARESGAKDLCDELLKYFVDEGHKECFAACLYTCYDLITPDVALELAWRKGMLDFCMPFLIQVLREYTGRVDGLDKKTQKKEEAEERNKSAANDFVPDMIYAGGMGGIGGPGGMLAIQGPGMQPQMGMGMPQAGQPQMSAPGAPQMFTPGGLS